jgi:FkbM family methyltransferase
MHKFIQTLCLAAYRVVSATGLLETTFGKRLFLAAYDIYKQSLEARVAQCLRQWITPGSVVVDVGANNGFFTVRFARWVEKQGRVLAIEPEVQNIRLLNRRVQKAGVAAAVEVIEGVAAEKSGMLRLALNPINPADHRIGEEGLPVRAWTVDEIVAARGWPTVSLIKIDVQGAEIRVLRGSLETIDRYKPVLFVEIDDRTLGQAGFSADMLFDEISGLGYRVYDPYNPSHPLTRSEAALQRRALGYADYLCRA